MQIRRSFIHSSSYPLSCPEILCTNICHQEWSNFVMLDHTAPPTYGSRAKRYFSSLISLENSVSRESPVV